MGLASLSRRAVAFRVSRRRATGNLRFSRPRARRCTFVGERLSFVILNAAGALARRGVPVRVVAMFGRWWFLSVQRPCHGHHEFFVVVQRVDERLAFTVP